MEMPKVAISLVMIASFHSKVIAHIALSPSTTYGSQDGSCIPTRKESEGFRTRSAMLQKLLTVFRGRGVTQEQSTTHASSQKMKHSFRIMRDRAQSAAGQA
ncbi:hypothetical protein EJ03DRAFT_53471 [Teratosphaeria nubilosa]|uniref:Uncharacterized protein n=1 Tax=Teratosphaeria nubilosa TaxID=161662 RepID=A0A6G1KU13_9PEZI|nr:hypothetical protein EJ03DRAFT_53471 [Teratosphaeria nubilosa]